MAVAVVKKAIADSTEKEEAPSSLPTVLIHDHEQTAWVYKLQDGKD